MKRSKEVVGRADAMDKITMREVLHASCLAHGIEVAEFHAPRVMKQHCARKDAIYYCLKTLKMDKCSVAKYFDEWRADIPKILNEVETWSQDKSRAYYFRQEIIKRILSKRDAKCKVVVIGSEVFGLKRKRDRSRHFSRRLCETVGEYIAALIEEQEKYRGWVFIGGFGGGRPNARKSLLDGKMRYLVLLVEPNGRALGDENVKGIFTVQDDGQYSLANFYLQRDYRGHGFGRKMLADFLARFRKDHKGKYDVKISLEVNCANEAATRLYAECGFSDWTKVMEFKV